MLGRAERGVIGRQVGASRAGSLRMGRTSAHPGALEGRSGVPEEIAMYLARFSYDVLPVNRQRAVDFIKREVQAARTSSLRKKVFRGGIDVSSIRRTSQS